MPLTIEGVEQVQLYLSGVMGRSEHHAQTVGGIALTLLGAILWKKDRDTSLEVRRNDGAMGNVAWFTIGGRRYALTYNHRTESIDLHQRSQSGKVIQSFTNTTRVGEVMSLFSTL